MSVALALQLITLHQADGRPVHINPAEITYFAAPRRDGAKLLGPESNCVVFFAGRHYFAVIETCEAVSRLIEGLP